ncbi:lipoprotein [Leptospira kmetyi]|uniref:lipoprotein n=1 Tax=Leptospira kmetyi TaxID=408139 RepID=UPI003EBAC54B
MKKILNILILLSVFSNISFCGISKFFKSSGSYHVAIMKPDGKSTLAIGKIASRDARFAPYLIDNFKDMLQLQLIDEGYSLKEIPSERKKKSITAQPSSGNGEEQKTETPEASKDSSKKNGEESSNNLRDLLPENLRNVLEKGAVVGFSDSSKETRDDDFLSSEEIKALSAKHNLQFFVQGAVGTNDSGTLLEEDSNSLVFLKIYDSNGNLKGGISYTVNGRTLAEATLLKEVCYKISNKMSDIVNKK